MKESKPAVMFHEYVSHTKTVDGTVYCTLSPLPMDRWKEDSKPVYKSTKSKIQDLINSSENDRNDDLDDYTKGYDDGYINALKYVLSIV